MVVQQTSPNAPATPTFAVAGQIKKVIDSSIYTDESVPAGSSLVFFRDTDILDLLRARTDTVWKETGRISPENAPIQITEFGRIKDRDTNKTFGEKVQRITLSANKRLFKFNPGDPPVSRNTFNRQMWKAFIGEIPPGPPVFTVQEPNLTAFGRTQPQEDTRPTTDIGVSDVPVTQNTNTGPQLRFGDEILGNQPSLNEDLPVDAEFQDNNAPGPNLLFTQQSEEAQDEGFRTDTGLIDIPQEEGGVTTQVGIVDAPVSEQAPTTFEFPTQQEWNFTPTIQAGMFFDHAFEIGIPYEKKRVEKLNLNHGLSFVDIKPEYNFFIDGYEQAISLSEIPESLIPNIYSFLTELQNENTDEKNTIFAQHITLAGTIPDQFVDVTNQKGQKIGESSKGQYFDVYARKIRRFINTHPDADTNLRLKFGNQALPISNIDLFREFNNKRELFPMYFDIQFSTDNTTQFAEILKDSQMSTVLAKGLIDGGFLPNSQSFQDITSDMRMVSGTVRPTFDSETKVLNVYDISDFIQKVVEMPVEEFEALTSGVFLGTYNNEIERAQNSQFELHKHLLAIIFAGKMKSLVNARMRSFEEVVKGQPAYSETALYRVEKFDTATLQVVQNFWLPNSNEIDVMRFIDTQVKYNKRYRYRIYAYQFVVGSKYRYNLIEVRNDTAQVDVVMEPSLQLVEILFHEFTGRIMDNPPISPDVNIIPFRAVNNEIKFNFNSNSGRIFLEPILIEPSDVDIISQLREAQMVSEEEFLEYETDDHAAAFEIFRVTSRPQRWQDFEGKRIALVSTDVDGFSLQKATAASFIDTILPNRKYYYVFRSIDNHGHISNPTPIYELEIVDDNGTIYPVVRVVEFDRGEDTKVCAKSVQRFIQIIPAFTQTILNEEKSGLVTDGKRVESVVGREKFHLGVAEEQVWKKSFKIRLTSRQTGKKIDFNVVFNNKHVKKEDGDLINNQGNTGAVI